MSNRAITWAFSQKVGSPTAKMVLIKLADQANDDGFCWPSCTTIAKHCEISRQHIPRYTKRLEQLGLLRIEHRKEGKTNLSNVYRLNLGGLSPQRDQGVPTVVTGVSPQRDQGVPTVVTGVSPQRDTNPHIEPSLNPKEEAQPKAAACPFGKIKEIYNANRGDLPECRDMTTNRKRALSARWRSDPKVRDLEWWGKYFMACAATDFLTGKNDRGWRADMDFLLKESTIAKIREGAYDRA